MTIHNILYTTLYEVCWIVQLIENVNQVVALLVKKLPGTRYPVGASDHGSYKSLLIFVVTVTVMVKKKSAVGSFVEH